MSIDDTDVLARLRASADTVEEHRFDAHEVLTESRRALRRRRTWQAAGACTTAVVVTFSLALAGPVPVPGLGDVTLPGSEQMRELLGLAEADASDCVAPEPAARQAPADESTTSLRPGVTYDVTDARPMSSCFDIRHDAVLDGAGLSPDALTEDGTFWRAPLRGSDVARFLRRVDPFDDGANDPLAAPLVTPVDGESRIGGLSPRIGSLTPRGNKAAWFEIVAGSTNQAPHRIVLSAGGTRSDAVTTNESEARSITEIEDEYGNILAVTAQRVAWRQEGAPTGSAGMGSTVEPETMPAWVAPIESGTTENLAVHATAIGADDDEIVVATRDELPGDTLTTTFVSFGDDGSETTVFTLEHPRTTYVRLVDITDDVLTYALAGSDLVVVPRANGVADPEGTRTVAVRLGDDDVESLSAAGDTVAWVSESVAYLLRGTAPSHAVGPDLVRIGQSGPRDRMMVGLAGDRIAWNTTGDSGVMVNVGTLLEPRGQATIMATDPVHPWSQARLVPAAPVVTVPEDAVFRTDD
jgi:hypothetical protein